MPEKEDEVLDVEDELEDEVDSPEDKVESTKTENAEKTFTQAQVNRIVAKRVKGIKAEKDALQEQLDSLDDEFAENVAELSKGIDAEVLELMEGLSNIEKYRKLSKLQGKLSDGNALLSHLPTKKREGEDKIEKKNKRLNRFASERI